MAERHSHTKHRAAALLLGLLFSLCLCLPAFAAGDSAPAGADGAAQLDRGIAVGLPGGQSAATLLDGNRSTYLKIAAGGEVAITSEAPFAYVYLIWDTPPGEWQAATADSYTALPGALHQLVSLSAPATAFTLKLDETEHTLCDVYLFGEGTLPGWVQQWGDDSAPADLLALPTHADDEHLFFGGILPTYAGERGYAVQVVYLTNHWGERYRPHELLDGLWTVGITRYPVMGPFPDLYASKESLAAAEATFGHEAVLEFQVEMLRRYAPRVVVGHDLAGEYGHGAHMLNAETLVEALALCGDAAAFPDSAATYGTCEVDKAYLHLYAENEIVMDWNTPLEHFGGATAFEMAEAGFAKHVSQLEYFSVQQSGTWQDCRRFGLIHSKVGPDVAKDDLFENIAFEPEPEPEPEPVPSEAAEPGPPSALPEPASAPASQAEAGAYGGDWLPFLFIVLGAALVTALVALLIFQNKKKKRR